MATLTPQFAISQIRPVAAEFLVGDLVQPGHPLFGTIWINPERLSGAPCFFGSRVPVKNLFDYLESGYTVDEFLSDFEGINSGQVTAVLELAQSGLLAELPKP